MSPRRWNRYVPVSERRRKAERALERLAKKGQSPSPVVTQGRTIASTFWGKAWCDNLERYSDFSNRLPRGRTYARNGSVLDLQISPREVRALVSGSRLYRVSVKVAAVPKARWLAICGDCVGAIDSLVELLQGRLSKAVMERIFQPATGLFPAPAELQFSCSCPDWASMCKHVAAVLYGIGARFDAEPELLFQLRRVDAKDLIRQAGKTAPLSRKAPARKKILADDDLSAIFGLELGPGDAATSPEPAKPRPSPKTRKTPRKTNATRRKPANRSATRTGRGRRRKDPGNGED